MRKLLALLAAVGVVAVPMTASAQQATTVDVSPSALRLAQPSTAGIKGQTRTYVVQLADKPALSYDGGLMNYAATAPARGERYDANASHVRMYVSHLEDKQNAKLQSIGASGRKIYSYTHTMNGFAARLTEQEAELLRGDKNVLGVWEDFAFELDTNNSPQFLGLDDRRKGLHRRLRLKGEDVIVGILDTGVTTDHPSFSDTRTFPLPRFCEHPRNRILKRICDRLERYRTRVVYDEPPAHWAGECEIGEGFSEAECNNKLIGARWYVDGFLAGRGSVVEGEFLSPRDSSGHGSHTMSTAAGNEVMASLNGHGARQDQGYGTTCTCRSLQGLLAVAGCNELQLLLL